MNYSPIRQLARDYYDGRITRADYIGRRRDLLQALAAPGDTQSAPAVTPEVDQSGLFDTLEHAQPDSSDLAKAFATRDNASALESEQSSPVDSEMVSADKGPRQEEAEVTTTLPRKSVRLKWLVLLLLCLLAGLLWQPQLAKLLSISNLPF